MHETTQTLLDSQAGNGSAAKRLAVQVYDELRRLAEQYVRREPPGSTLQATALVHEAYLRLVDQSRVDWKGKTHFLAVGAEMIRRILVDHARQRAAAKRGGERGRAVLEEGLAAPNPGDPIDLLTLDEALQELTARSPRQGRVVELRYFGGMSVEETAYALGVSERTVKEDWRLAKAWLGYRIEGKR